MSTHMRSRSALLRMRSAAAALLLAAFIATSASSVHAQADQGEAVNGAGTARVIGFIEGHGERSLADDLSKVAAALSPEYELRAVDLAQGEDGLENVTALVMAGSPDVPDVELYQLDQFLMRGGGVLYLLDAAVIPHDGLRSNVAEGNIFGFLSTYGVTVNADLVLDPACAPGASHRALDTAGPYPYWPGVGPGGLSPHHAITAGLDTLRFSWTSSITVMPTSERSREVLARSSGRSWTVDGYADLSPAQEFTPTGELAERAIAGRGAGYVLAVALEGRFGSAFEGRKVIVQNDEGVSFFEPEGMLRESAPARMVVFGNSLMFTDELAEQFPENAGLIASSVDWLAENAAAPRQADARNGGTPSGTSAVLIILAVCAVAVAVGALLVAHASRRRKA